MQHRIKQSLVMGGLGWGIPMALMMMSLRWIEAKPFDGIILTICIVAAILGGIAFAWLSYLKEPHDAFNWISYVKSGLLIIVVMTIYALIYRLILLPQHWHHGVVASFIFLSLMGLSIVLQHKFILNTK
ncbi:hypothetical protein [uncultured Acinetobacter sp.]|uniref:hypothetical protein n=1 Tax=uncultured Acinetobacter sp. TaxID=165433 RepID=UPI002616F238|nr:hypothetical protein [uncultured Acinetobacter sp.]